MTTGPAVGGGLDRPHVVLPAEAGAAGPPLLLLHGTGGDEHDLLPLRDLLSPGAAVLSVRGTVLENGMPRFFGRLREGVFDEDDLRRQADDLATFVETAGAAYGIDPGTLVAVGFSNGANIASALLLRRPGLLRGAVLLSAMVPFVDPPAVDLAGTRVVVSNGERDPMVPAAVTERLVTQLRDRRADVTELPHPGGHQIRPASSRRSAHSSAHNRVMISELPFGTTGHASTRVIFGAAALGEVTQEEADRTLELVRAHGVNHLDTAASYGESELRLAPFLADHRAEVFLATKTGERDAEAAWAEINRSLERLGVDQVDLIQLHNLVDEAEWEQAYAPGGVLEAAVRARDEGLVRHIGVTGHGITVARQHLRSLQRFDFSSVLLPYNFPMSRNAAYLDEFEALAAVCGERGVALQTIKSITKAPWSEGAEQHAATWYEPLKDPEAIDTAVAWVLGRPDVFLNTVGDIHVLPLVLDAAERFFTDGAERPDVDVMADLERRWDMAPLFV